jgi:beta-glucanase (GH16 family)
VKVHDVRLRLQLTKPKRVLATIAALALIALAGAWGTSRSFSRGHGRTSAGETAPTVIRPQGIGGAWTLRFDDEFNGIALDRSKWSSGWLDSGVTPPVNSYEQACYVPSQVTESGGSLNLSVLASPCTVGGRTYPYRSGMVNSNGKAEFTYGLFEARLYLPGFRAQIANWPAWWTDGHVWPTDGEMDILERLDGQACYRFHSSPGEVGGCANEDFTGWHTYCADWEPGSITYYRDGRAVGYITTGVTSAPMYLILNDAVNGTGGAALAPSTMRVDYVRVWSKT